MITTTCSICFREFQSYPSQKREFCSLKCMTVWRGKRQTRKSRQRRPRKKCVVCRKTYLVKKSHKGLRKTCSLRCMGMFRTKNMVGKQSSNWKGGVSQRYQYGSGFTKELKVAVLDRDGRCCRACTSRHRLNVHHRNGIKTDNVIRNLITLCARCHRRVHRAFEAYVTRKYGVKEKEQLNRILIKMFP